MTNRTYDRFLEAIRVYAKDGDRSDLNVVDDYEYDSSARSAGEQRAIALIGLTASLTVQFRIPVEETPDGHVFTFNKDRLLCGPAGDDDPQPVLREALEGQDKLLSAIIWEEIDDKHSFRTKEGLKALNQSYNLDDVKVVIEVKHTENEYLRHTGIRLGVSLTIRLSAYESA